MSIDYPPSLSVPSDLTAPLPPPHRSSTASIAVHLHPYSSAFPTCLSLSPTPYLCLSLTLSLLLSLLRHIHVLLVAPDLSQTTYAFTHLEPFLRHTQLGVSALSVKGDLKPSAFIVNSVIVLVKQTLCQKNTSPLCNCNMCSQMYC